MTQEATTPPPWAGGPGGPSFVPTQPYVCVGGDSLPRIAELYGHAGEWQALAEANEGHIWLDYNNLQPGLEITVPADWMGVLPKSQAEEVAEAAEHLESHSGRRSRERDD